MKRQRFGRTSLDVSPIGFGGAEIGLLETAPDVVDRLLGTLLDAGVNVIDTAAMYESSETLIGNAIGHRRDESVLVTKCGPAVPDHDGPAFAADVIRHTVDRALARLRTDRLDACLLHSCDLETLQKGDALGALVDLRDAGKIVHVGYSGDNAAAAWAAIQPDVAVVQTSVSVADQANLHTVLPACRLHDVGVMAKRPLANAAWRHPSDMPDRYAGYVRPYAERIAAMDLGHPDVGLDGQADPRWAEVALRFTLAQAGVHTAIVGTTSPDHVEANLAAAAAPPLPLEVVAAIRRAFTAAESEAEELWLGLT